MDRFVTSNQPGLLILHGNGNVLQRHPRRRAKKITDRAGALPL